MGTYSINKLWILVLLLLIQFNLHSQDNSTQLEVQIVTISASEERINQIPIQDGQSNLRGRWEG